MEDWSLLLKLLVEYRPAVLLDPMGTLPVLADNLEDSCGSLGQEAANALRYWCRVRDGHQAQDSAYEEWFTRVMAKYGPAEVIGRDGEQREVSRLCGRVLNYWTRVIFTNQVSPALIQGQPIVSVEIVRPLWNAIYLLGDPCWRNTQELTLDYRDGHIRTLGVVRGLESIMMPCLRRIMVHVDVDRNSGSGIKGRAAVALNESVLKGEVPRGVQLWWNGERT